jgi:hypothetical protein
LADQNFRVKRGLEVGVGKTVLYADPGGNIGVGITQPSTKLEVAGDLSLYNGSTYSTVIQSITPTANRTISFPDQTGTIGLVAGSTGNVQYNGGGILSGTSNFNVQPVWDSGSTNYTGLKLNVTDPVSGNASYLSPSNLLDLQVDGTAQLRVNNFGQIYRSTPPSTSGIRLKTNTGVADYGISDNNSHVNIVYNSTGALSVTSNLVGIGGSRRIGFSTNQSWDTVDLVFGRDAANTLAQRNGGTDLDPVSQTYRLYNFSVDSTSDYERTSITDDSTGLVINQEYDGTGALRTNLLDIQDNGTSKVTITGSGNVGVATTNPQYKIDVNGSVGIGGSIFDTNNSQGVSGYVLTSTAAGILWQAVTSPGVGAISGVNVSTESTDAARFIPFVSVSSGTTTHVKVAPSDLTFNPSTSRLGIGTTNPTAKLDVNGDVSIASTVSIGTVIDIVPDDSLGKISFTGSAGQLLSIANNLTSGSIFSVDDVTGIPSFDVNADGTVLISPIGNTEYVGVGKTDPQAKLDIKGNVLIDGNLGIATTNPTSRLQVGSATTESVFVTSDGDVLLGTNTLYKTGERSLHISGTSSIVSNNYGSLTLANLSDGGNQQLGAVDFYSGSTHSAQILAVKGAGGSSGTGSLQFKVQNSSTLVDIVGIDTSSLTIGKLNGTSNGSLKIYNSIFGTSTNGITLGNMQTGAGSNIDIDFVNYQSAPYGKIRGVYTGIGTITQKGDLAFFTADGGTETEKVRINSSGSLLVGSATSTGTASQTLQVTGGTYISGSVGIGTTNPSTKLEVAGDLSLYNGSTYSTVIQSITPTANRTISFPDQTGTIGLVAGSTGNVQYNNAGKLAGSSDFNVDLDWNESSTVFTGLKLNVTDTASLSDSKLLDLQVGGTSQFSISSKDPGLGGGGGFALLSRLINVQRYFGSAIIINGSDASNGLKIGQSVSGHLDISASDFGVGFNLLNGRVLLSTDAANTFAQRDGTNAQTYRLYNTYTNASNYQRTSITDDNSGLVINQEYDGTGALRTNLLDIQDNGTSKVVVTGSGNVGVATTNPQYKLHVVGDFAATTKSFVIPHPTKPGLTLRHGNLEGPENAVYVRGKTTESIIPLPDYWTGLVDEETITVNLTPKNRKLHSVVGISSNTVEVECVDGEIDCYFMILGERKDVAKLVTEY